MSGTTNIAQLSEHSGVASLSPTLISATLVPPLSSVIFFHLVALSECGQKAPDEPLFSIQKASPSLSVLRVKPER